MHASGENVLQSGSFVQKSGNLSLLDCFELGVSKLASSLLERESLSSEAISANSTWRDESQMRVFRG